MKIRNRLRPWLVGHGERFAKEELGFAMSEIRDTDHFWQLYRVWRRPRVRRKLIVILISFALGVGLAVLAYVLFSP